MECGSRKKIFPWEKSSHKIISFVKNAGIENDWRLVLFPPIPRLHPRFFPRLLKIPAPHSSPVDGSKAPLVLVWVDQRPSKPPQKEEKVADFGRTLLLRAGL